MRRPVLWTDAAEADLQQAIDWYGKISPDLAARFLSAVEATTNDISDNPLQFAVVLRQKRRAGVKRFPYGLIFEAQDDYIAMLACFHGRRDPRRWQSR